MSAAVGPGAEPRSRERETRLEALLAQFAAIDPGDAARIGESLLEAWTLVDDYVTNSSLRQRAEGMIEAAASLR